MSKTSEKLITIVAVIPFFAWLYRYIRLDFFYDEVYSLVHYVFVPIKKTVAQYQDANNHILSNLINNIYVKLISEESLYTLMDHTYIIRLVQLVYVIITLIVFYHLCKKYFNKYVALFSLVLLTTSIPYYNFTLQLRGYNLSILLLCLVLYFLWDFEKEYRWTNGLLLSVWSALFIYSMPSNLYTLSGIGIFYVSEGCVHYIRRIIQKPSNKSRKSSSSKDSKKPFIYKNRDAVIIFLLFFGVLLAALLFSPLLEKMLKDPNLQSKGFFYKPTLLEMIPSVLDDFISWRYLVVLAAVAGLIYCTIMHKKFEWSFIRAVLFSVVVLITPFIISFVRGDRPYDRFFVNLILVFCLVISLGLYFLVRGIIQSKGLYIIGILFLYTNITFAFGINHIKRKLMNDIINDSQSVSLLYNYFQAHYAPMRLLRFFTENYPEARKSVPFVVHYCDRGAIPEYLKKVNQPITDIHIMNELLKNFDKIYVLTSAPNVVRKEYAIVYPDFTMVRLNEKVQFHNIFLLSKKPDKRMGEGTLRRQPKMANVYSPLLGHAKGSGDEFGRE